MKKKRNQFILFNRKKYKSEKIEQQAESQETTNESTAVLVTDNIFLFELMEKELSGYELSLVDKTTFNKESYFCSRCGYPLRKVDNMIVIYGDNIGVFGINGYYCYSCNMIHVYDNELMVIQNSLTGDDISSLEMAVLSNCEHNMDKKLDNGLLHREATLRNVLDKINAIKDNDKYRIVKASILPEQCPVCDRLFDCSDNILVLHRNDCEEEYIVNGCYCRWCGLMYVSEESLAGCIKDGLTIKNLSKAIVNEELDEEGRIIKGLEQALADGKTLFIHEGNIICDRQHHDVVSVTAEVPTGSDGEIVRININYCRDCDRCFINKIVYDTYRLRGELPLIRFAKVKNDGSYPSEFETELAEESPLHLLGYNVGQADDFSDTYRQNLLANIMDCGALSKHEIENYLSFFIQRAIGNRNMQIAVGKWERDLEFVERYNINRQAKVKVISVEPLR